MTDFVLDKFVSSFTMGLSGEILSVPPKVLTVDATAILHVTVAQMKATFRFQTDASNVNDLSSADLKYYVHANEFPTRNPSLAKLDEEPNTAHAIQTIGSSGSNYDTGVMRVEDDYVRYLALKLFNTPYGVDLFSNVDALITDLSNKGEAAWTAIVAIMTAVDATNGTIMTNGTNMAMDASNAKYLTETNKTEHNLTRELMTQMLVSNKSRFADIAAGGDVEQSLPFQANDTISFKLTIKAADGQHHLTGVVDEIPERSYRIKFVIDA